MGVRTLAYIYGNSPTAGYVYLEKLRAMFASVQNWLALMLMLVNVLHCRSVMSLQVTRLRQGLSVRVGC